MVEQESHRVNLMTIVNLRKIEVLSKLNNFSKATHILALVRFALESILFQNLPSYNPCLYIQIKSFLFKNYSTSTLKSFLKKILQKIENSGKQDLAKLFFMLECFNFNLKTNCKGNNATDPGKTMLTDIIGFYDKKKHSLLDPKHFLQSANRKIFMETLRALGTAFQLTRSSQLKNALHESLRFFLKRLKVLIQNGSFCLLSLSTYLEICNTVWRICENNFYLTKIIRETVSLLTTFYKNTSLDSPAKPVDSFVRLRHHSKFFSEFCKSEYVTSECFGRMTDRFRRSQKCVSRSFDQLQKLSDSRGIRLELLLRFFQVLFKIYKLAKNSAEYLSCIKFQTIFSKMLKRFRSAFYLLKFWNHQIEIQGNSDDISKIADKMVKRVRFENKLLHLVDLVNNPNAFSSFEIAKRVKASFSKLKYKKNSDFWASVCARFDRYKSNLMSNNRERALDLIKEFGDKSFKILEGFVGLGRNHILVDLENTANLFNKFLFFQIVILQKQALGSVTNLVWDPLVFKFKIYSKTQNIKIIQSNLKNKVIKQVIEHINRQKPSQISILLDASSNFEKCATQIPNIKIYTFFENLLESFPILKITKYKKFLLQFLLSRLFKQLIVILKTFEYEKLCDLEQSRLLSFYVNLSNMSGITRYLYTFALDNNFIDLSKSFLSLRVNLYFLAKNKPISRQKLQTLGSLSTHSRSLEPSNSNSDDHKGFFWNLFTRIDLQHLFDQNISFYFYFLYKKFFCSKDIGLRGSIRPNDLRTSASRRTILRKSFAFLDETSELTSFCCLFELMESRLVFEEMLLSNIHFLRRFPVTPKSPRLFVLRSFDFLFDSSQKIESLFLFNSKSDSGVFSFIFDRQLNVSFFKADSNCQHSLDSVASQIVDFTNHLKFSAQESVKQWWTNRRTFESAFSATFAQIENKMQRFLPFFATGSIGFVLIRSFRRRARPKNPL